MKKTISLIFFTVCLLNTVDARCIGCHQPPIIPSSGGPKDFAAIAGGTEGTIGSVVNVPASNLPDVYPPAVTNTLEQLIPFL